MDGIGKLIPSVLQKILDYFEIRPVFAYFGASFAFCWSHATQRLVYNNLDGIFQVVQYVGTAGACLILFLIAKKRRKNLSEHKNTKIICVVTGFVCSPFIVLPLWQANVPIMMIVAIVSGALLAVLYLMWGSFYALLDIKAAVIILCGAQGFSSVLKIFTDFLGHDISGMLTCMMLPLASVFCFNHARKNPPSLKRKTNRYHRETVYTLKNLAIGIIVFSYAMGLFMMTSSEIWSLPAAMRVISLILIIIIDLGIIVTVYLFSNDFSLSKVWFFVLLTIATGSLIANFDEGIFGYVSLSIFTTAQLVVIVFCWLGLADVSHHSEYPSDVIFGLGWSLYALPISLGLLTAYFLPEDFDHGDLALNVQYLLMIVLFFFMNKRQPHDLRLFGDLTSPLPKGGGIDRFSFQVGCLADRYGLTNREQEVVMLYAQGRSRVNISLQLIISESTVRDHIRNVYKKTGIHDKQELIDAIQRMP